MTQAHQTLQACILISFRWVRKQKTSLRAIRTVEGFVHASDQSFE